MSFRGAGGTFLTLGLVQFSRSTEARRTGVSRPRSLKTQQRDPAGLELSEGLPAEPGGRF
jgi:hypothetical protein